MIVDTLVIAAGEFSYILLTRHTQLSSHSNHHRQKGLTKYLLTGRRERSALIAFNQEFSIELASSTITSVNLP